MAIAVGQSKGKAATHQSSTDSLLVQWGTRMWTFPEVLLSPGQQIPIYMRGGNLRSPLILSKNQYVLPYGRLRPWQSGMLRLTLARE